MNIQIDWTKKGETYAKKTVDITLRYRIFDIYHT
jgi:hypothetical protein